MEAFGRVIAIILAALSLVFSLLFYRTASYRIQSKEAATRVCKEFTARVLQEKRISKQQVKQLREQVKRLGSYDIEVCIFIRSSIQTEETYRTFYQERYLDSVSEETNENEWTSLQSGSILRLSLIGEQNLFFPFQIKSRVPYFMGGMAE